MVKIFATFFFAFLFPLLTLTAQHLVSPDKKISLERKGDVCEVKYKGNQVLEIYRLGLTTSHHEGNCSFGSFSGPAEVVADYTMLSGKRLHCQNEANEYVMSCQFADGKPFKIRIRLFNDGITFRYEVDGLDREKITDEQTAYRIQEGTRRWIQRWTEAYEEFFPLTTSGKGLLHKWGYPALIEPSDGVFALISEANIERCQSASWLSNEWAIDVYKVCPDKNDVEISGSWHSPWRVVIIGGLSDIVESTLITDVSEPDKLADSSWVKPGVVSWVYWAYNHGSNDFNIIKKYVDLAVELKLPYVLIDAEWDNFKDGLSVVDAVNYAKKCGIRPLIWYNSSVGWINGAPGPKFKLNKPEDREKEFQWCEDIGVAGVKIDFFSGDNQMNMDYCIELMECAARHHLLVNFHGATIPRGWQRTYPNLLSTEGVYGAEWYNNVPTFTKKAAAHNATLPFTRNVIGPMDYTPCAFSDSQHPHITTHAHELALTVLFESGLQHLADRPESLLAQPQQVRDFFSHLPNVWDDTRLLAGYPGKYAAIARKSGDAWYVAAINGLDEEQTVKLDWNRVKKLMPKKLSIQAFADSGDKDNPWQFLSLNKLPKEVRLLPRGGVVLVIR